MSSSPPTPSPVVLALRPDEINSCIYPTGQPFHAVTSTEDHSRTSYLSSLNIKLLKEFEWNVYVGDVVVVSTSIQVVEMQPGAVAAATTTTLKQYAQHLHEWESGHYTKPARHWRVGLVLALRSKITRTSKAYECHIQWLDKAIDYSSPSSSSMPSTAAVWKKLQEHFRSYKAQQGNKGAHLPHILVNKPGEFDVVSPLQLLPVKITMLPQKHFVQHGVYTKPNDPSGRESDERQFDLKFCCLKRYVTVGSSNISLVPEPNPDAWTQFNAPTEMHTESPLDEIPLPSPLDKAWQSWIPLQHQQHQSQGGGSDIEAAQASSSSSLHAQLRDALLKGWREARLNRYTAYLADCKAKAEQERRDRLLLEREEEQVDKQKKTKGIMKNERTTSSTSSSRSNSRTANGKNGTKKKEKESSSKMKRKISGRDDDEVDDKSHKKKKSIWFASDAGAAMDYDDIDDSNIRNKKRKLATTKTTKAKSKSSTKMHDHNDSPSITDDTASVTTHDTHSTDTTAGAQNGVKAKKKMKKTDLESTTRNKTNKDIAIKKKKSDSYSSASKSYKRSNSSTLSSKDRSSKKDAVENDDSKASSLDTSLIDTEWDVHPGHKYPIGTVGGNDYYGSVSMTIQDAQSLESVLNTSSIERVNRLCKGSTTKGSVSFATFTVGVGSVVAIQCDSAKSPIPSSQYQDGSECDEWWPFCIPWGVAQIMSICKPKDANDVDAWQVHIRWFYRFCELSQGRQTEVVGDDGVEMYEKNGIIETQEMSSCSLSSVLPASVILTSDPTEFENYREADGSLWPTIPYTCRHFCPSLGGKANKHKIKNTDDWKFKYQNFCSSIPCDAEEIPVPFQRFIEKIRQPVRPLYVGWFQGNASEQPQHVLDNLQSTVSKSRLNKKVMDGGETKLDASAIVAASDVVYEQWGKKFYDSVKFPIDRKVFSKTEDVPTVRGWTLMVGHIIPVQINERRTQKTSEIWLPFAKAWNPAQVVSVYQLDSGDWMMQIRWFYRFREIEERHRESLAYLDRPHTVFETEHFQHLPVTAAMPGRIVLMSFDDEKDWVAQTGENTGIPFIPRLCSHICLDDEIRPIMDWSNYDAQLHALPPPLRRGLELRPINRENKEWIPMLTRYYVKAIERRNEDIDIKTLQRWTSSVTREQIANWNDVLVFTDEGVNIVHCNHLFKTTTEEGVTQRFFQEVEISTPTSFISTPTPEMRRAKCHNFGFSVGDVVCYSDEKVRSLHKRALNYDEKEPWYPFLAPWSYGQVLSIYDDGVDPTRSNLKMEIRRFYRQTEISIHASAMFLEKQYSSKENVFESDSIIDGVPVSHVMGTAELFLGHHQNSGMDERNHTRSKLKPVISCRSKCFYFHEYEKLQPIYCSSLLSTVWHKTFLERGFSHSHIIRKYPKLIQMMTTQISNSSQGDFRDLLSPQKDSPQKEGSYIDCGNDLFKTTSGKIIFAELTLRPQWSLFHATERIFRFQEANDKGWILKIGDVVAIKASNQRDDALFYFPFKISWIPARVLALFAQSDGSDDVGIEILPLSFKYADDRHNHPLIIDHGSQDPTIVETSEVLGPLVVHFHASLALDDTNVQRHIPTPEFWADSSLDADASITLRKSRIYNEEEMKRVRSLVNIPEVYSSFNSYTVNHDQASHGLGTSHSPGDSWTTKKPFLMDSSTNRAFYNDLTLIPLEDLESTKAACIRRPITVKIGDIVLVRFDGPKRYPYKCSWGVAEVVAIFTSLKKTGSDFEMENLPTIPTNDGDEVYRVEVRWFYEREDVSTFSRMIEFEATSELLETDHTQVVEAGAILRQTTLIEDNNVESCVRGVDQFLCRRFWSTTRKALVPINGLKGRQRRGRLYSKCLPVSYLEDSLDEQHPSQFEQTVPDKQGWKEAIEILIGKLTLKDASKCAYKNGETLVGREKEFEDLMKFFRSAIRGEAGADGIKSSCTVSGPPGTGKTASVRAALARLQDEQSKGLLPNFRFIPLNGMELRHPYDAYIRLWEALVGRKHVGTYENAADKIREIFTAPASASSESVGDSAIVVLLDEIDYLLTEKQSVLFDFFDWPKCAAGIAGGHRLVVVGVSNTLNLTDQLLPKVQSRVGSEKCIFRAYSLNDTVSILKSKMEEASPHYRFFEDDAILFAAKKTAALSGDIRKAFQICRGAAEAVLQRFGTQEATADREDDEQATVYPKIKISDVLKASQDSFNKALVTAVSFCTPFQALLLISLASLARSTGRQTGGFDIKDIMMKMEAIADTTGDTQYSPPPAFGETLELLNRLGEMNLIFMNTPHSTSTSYRASKGGSGGAWPMTTPAIDELTLLRGLKSTRHRQLAEKVIPSLF